MSEYAIGNIKRIAKDEIEYLDENGNIRKIDLCQCHSNWLNYCKRKENSILKSLLRKKPQLKCVGIRELLAEKPYYQFCDLEKTKFVFINPNNNNEKYNKCHTVENQLMACGW